MNVDKQIENIFNGYKQTKDHWATAEVQAISALNKVITNNIQQHNQDLVEKITCKECSGSGAYQSPSMYEPCVECDGTGWNLDGCANDVLEDVLKTIKEEK